MTNLLDLETRQKIYKLLVSNPGLNLSTIAEQLTMSVPLVDYHLHAMEENRLVTVEREEGHKRYYIFGTINKEEKKILSLLHQDIPLRIILYFLQHQFTKPKDIRQALEISPALLTYYLKKFVRFGVIQGTLSEEKKEFMLVDEQRVVNLLIRYKPNILLKRFKDSWVVDFPLSSKVSGKEEEKE
jgi:predicted transcriptional regulator